MLFGSKSIGYRMEGMEEGCIGRQGAQRAVVPAEEEEK